MSRQSPEFRTRFGQNAAGFSLVEVTLALGLISFAVVTILALLPSGMTSLRASMDQTVEAQIVRSIGARSVLAGFDNAAVANLYFDEEGQQTTTASQARFVVNIADQTPSFPGSASLDESAWRPVARALRIEIVRKPSPTASGTTNFHSLMVANSGH